MSVSFLVTGPRKEENMGKSALDTKNKRQGHNMAAAQRARSTRQFLKKQKFTFK
jgi:hypothetical protein